MSIAELKQACFSANSADEILKAFEFLKEIGCNETDLGMACWELANEFYEEGKHTHKILCLGEKGLEIFDHIVKNSTSNSNGNCYLVISRISHLLGRVCYQSKEYIESIHYLNLAVVNLMTCLERETDGSSSDHDVVYDILSDAHFELSRVKRAMGILDDAGYHLRKGLEKSRDKCDEIGMANEQVAEDYIKAMNFEEALSFYWEAEEIYMKQLMPDPVLVMDVRRNIALVYDTLGENEKALAVIQLSLSSSKGMDSSKTLMDAMILNADMLMKLGRFQEAFRCYKAVIPHAETLGDEGTRASVLISMARARLNEWRVYQAKKYIRYALRIVKKEIDSNRVFLMLEQMSSLYEQMDEFESVISLARRLLAFHNLPENFLVEYSERLFNMVNKSGNEKHVELLDHVMERLKNTFGPVDFQVGYGYVWYGTLYLKFGKPDLAAEYLALANSVMDVCLSPDEPDSLVMAHALSKTYAKIGRYDQAIECEEKVIEVLGFVPSHKDLLDEAVGLLNKYKQRASGKGPSSPSCSKR